MPNNPPRRHHTVPRLYLQRFSAPSSGRRRLWVIDAESGHERPGSVSNEPDRNDFYGPFESALAQRIDRSGAITVTLPYVEMGQGAYTAQAQLLAEELEVDIAQLTLEHAPPDEKLFSHPVFGDQITGGSAGLRGAWEPMRRAVTA